MFLPASGSPTLAYGAHQLIGNVILVGSGRPLATDEIAAAAGRAGLVPGYRS